MVGRADRAHATLVKLRQLCLALPDAHEVTAWGAPTFRVNNRMFATWSAPDGHHGDRPALWCKVAPGNKELLIRADPERYFSPPYVGPSGWVGMWLDRRPRWSAVREIVSEGHELVQRRPGRRPAR